jgi:putative spermidine/putrescine transport system substrate-binding protein
MQRRSFLLTLSSLAIAPVLNSCQGQDRAVLRVLALKNSLPPKLLGEFSQSINDRAHVELVAEGQFKEIFTQLQTWYKTGEAEYKGFKLPFIPPAKSPAYIPNLVSMGDAWLSTAIQEKSITPIETQGLINWGKLDARWRELPLRDERGNSSSTGKVWGVPYRWGTTVIIYRRDQLEAAGIPIPQDWSDLWHPKLRQRVSLLDRSREVIGLTLKKLGYSYNHPDLNQVSNLKSELQKLHQQAKFYSSDAYLQPLIMGHTWAAVGWSADAIELIRHYPHLGAIVPRSGTAIWADLWVQPTTRTKSLPIEKLKLTQQWIDYSLQPQVSNQISILTTGTAPLLTSLNPREIMTDIQQNPLILPPKTILDKSEFIYPLASANQGEYDKLWQEIRQVITPKS